MCLILTGQIRISPGSLQGDAYWLVAAEECIYVGLEFLRFEALWEAWKLTGELCGNRGRPWIAGHPDLCLAFSPRTWPRERDECASPVRGRTWPLSPAEVLAPEWCSCILWHRKNFHVAPWPPDANLLRNLFAIHSPEFKSVEGLLATLPLPSALATASSALLKCAVEQPQKVDDDLCVQFAHLADSMPSVAR